MTRSDEILDETSGVLWRELMLAKRVARFWTGEHSINVSLEKSVLPPVVKQVAIALFIKACRQYRTVIELVERREAADAGAIARCMFETWLTIVFVLAKSIRGYSRIQGATRRKKRGRPFTRELRACLYLLHCALDDERYWHNVTKIPKLRSQAMATQGRLAPSAISWLEAKVGPAWQARLRSTKHYSGLNIKELSQRLGKTALVLYTAFYGNQSSIVHAVDGLDYISIEKDALRGEWYSTIDQTRGQLRVASILFLGITDQFVEHIHTSRAKQMLIREFLEELKALSKEV